MIKPFVICEYKTNMIPSVKVGGIGDFSVYKTFDCGQCFRFDPVENSSNKVEFGGTVFRRYVRFIQNDDNTIDIIGSTEEDFYNIWLNYLSLDMNYDFINKELVSVLDKKSDIAVMQNAIEASRGIRILRQDPWEALCSFIISQNNNIPRIKKIIKAMCEKYGEPFSVENETYYTFPTAESLALSTPEEIFTLKCGFRARYIHDAAVKIHEKSITPEMILNAPDYESADAILRKIKGVGAKVSACALLFGYGRLDAFPIDVWIKRVMEKHFPDGLDYKKFGNFAGIAQQYLFYYERYLGGNKITSTSLQNEAM